MRHMDRRQFMQRALGAGAAMASVASLSQAAARAAAPAVNLATTSLGGGISLISGGGGNVVVFDSSAGVLMVDGGSPAASAEVLKQVRQFTGKPQVHTLFNTHWHWDQTGSNFALGSAGARIIAHENTRLWLSTDVNSKWEQRRYPRQPAKALPNQTFYTTGALEFGGEHIEYGYLMQAHTDGDLFVHFRNADVLVVGDVLTVGRYPLIDYCTGGWIGGMATAAQTLLARCTASTRIVAGTGAVAGREKLAAEQAML